MLTVMLGILKIAGLVLLAVLGLLLFLLLSVLLIPIRYQAEGSYQENTLTARARVSWFCRILSLTMVYDKKRDICVRLFGIPIKWFREERDTEKEVEEETAKKQETKAEREVQRTEKTQSKLEAQKKAHSKSVEKKVEMKGGNGKQAQETPSTQQKPDKRDVRKKNLGNKWKNKLVRIAQKIKARWTQLIDKKEEFQQKLTRLLTMLRDETNQRMFRLVKRQVFGIVRHILPTSMKGRIRFGFADPFQTGQVLAYISPFYALYAKHLELIPVFEEAVFEGNGKLRGRIRIGTVLAKGLRLLLDKDIREQIRKIQKK